LLLATGGMLAAFLGITVRPSDIFGAGSVPAWVDLTSMLAWQVIAGFAFGLIYAASLYFGMVLSRGSAEHSGYHESLIGLGGVLGPGLAAAVQWAYPGDIRAGITVVSALLATTALAAVMVTIRLGRSNR
jgi:hypothetical protein